MQPKLQHGHENIYVFVRDLIFSQQRDAMPHLRASPPLPSLKSNLTEFKITTTTALAMTSRTQLCLLRQIHVAVESRPSSG